MINQKSRDECKNKALDLMINGEKCSNYCNYECYLFYMREIESSISVRNEFDDPDRQLLHDLFIRILKGIGPRKKQKKTDKKDSI